MDANIRGGLRVANLSPMILFLARLFINARERWCDYYIPAKEFLKKYHCPDPEI
jgi:hypothetical protein